MKEGFFAFLGGVVVGAVTALLVAPQSGKETREEVIKFLDDAENTIKKRTEALLEEGKKQLEKIKEKANTLVDEGKKVVSSDNKSKSGKTSKA